KSPITVTRQENLPRRAAPAGDRAGDGAGLIAGRLAGEEERVRHRFGQRAVRVAAADAGVAVGAAAEGIGLPVVRVRGVELRRDAAARHAEDRGERLDASLDDVTLGQQAIGGVPARPTGHQRRARRRRRPPGRKVRVVRLDELEVVLPELLAKAKDDLDYVADFDAIERALL